MPEVTLISITPNAEKVIEDAGRTAYLSFHRKGKNSAKKFIQMLIRCGHTSVLEHASATFRIRGGSRSFTHQLVRHRLASFCQQSQRYVSEKEFKFIIPKKIKDNPQAKEIFISTILACQEGYATLLEMGIPKEDARYLLPNAIESEIVITANMREWRHILSLRCAPSAQWEIRKICLEILKLLKKEVPSVFADFEIQEDRESAQITNISQ
jgi:thymidylate synthase (FAD)